MITRLLNRMQSALKSGMKPAENSVLSPNRPSSRGCRPCEKRLYTQMQVDLKVISSSRSILAVRNMSQSAESAGTTAEVVDKPPEYLSRMNNNFCRVCGSKLSLMRAANENHASWRHICSSCGFIDYQNPRMVVGAIVEHEGKILMCRRGIEPSKGKWTIPAGYMELAESSAHGAARETREEACAEVTIEAPYCHWDIPAIGQAYILFRGQLAPPFTHAPGAESLETALFAPQDIPWSEIAFSSVATSLKYYLEDRRSGHWRFHHGVINKKPGSGPNDPATFGVEDVLQVG